MSLRTQYDNYFAEARELYKDRIEKLATCCCYELPRYVKNETPLFILDRVNNSLTKTMADIRRDLISAAKCGIHFVEYRVHKHYYPGYKGDNISFLTGKYYISGVNGYIEIPGAPSYTAALASEIPGTIVTFREGEYNGGVLRVEVGP